MGVDTVATRGGTLSQPCLPISSTVGATRIFPHLFLGSQKDVIDEVIRVKLFVCMLSGL